MDKPQNPQKPVNELLKDLYGPSEAVPLNTSADQPLDQPSTPPAADLPVDSQPFQPAPDYWPPVQPTVGTSDNQPPWVEPTENSDDPKTISPPIAPPIESSYPKPPIFQTATFDEPTQEEPSIEPASETVVTPEATVVPDMIPPTFTSPLPPRPEPAMPVDVVTVSASSPPINPSPKKKSKLLLLLPVLAILAIGLAIFLFIKSKSVNTTSGPVTLTYWGLFEPNSVFQQVITDYQKVNPNITINYQQQSGLKEYRERLATALPKDNGPDIFRIHLSWVPMFVDSLATIPSSVYSPSDFTKDYYPSAVSGLTTKKGIVGLPIYFDALALFYNEDLFRAAGQTPPSTWEDLIKSACTLTVRDETGKIKTGGVAIGSPANVDHWSDVLGLMLLQNGANPVAPDVCNDQGGCPGQDALTFFTSFVKNSACRDSQGAFLGSSWTDLLPSSTYSFATGQVAMYFAPSWRVFDIKNLNPNLNFKIVPVPQLSTDVKDRVAWATYWVESVSAKSSNPTEAWKFIKYLSSKEVLEKLYLAQTNLGSPRMFGEPYPRVEMASMLTADPLVGPFISQAPFAKNWYLSAYTNDNGINDNIIKYYEDATNKAISGQDTSESLKTVSQGVAQILSRYGLQALTR